MLTATSCGCLRQINGFGLAAAGGFSAAIGDGLAVLPIGAPLGTQPRAATKSIRMMRCSFSLAAA